MTQIRTFDTDSVSRADLHLADYNPRTISKKMLSELCESLVTYGFVQPVVVRKEDGLVIGGHQRLAAYDALVAEHGENVLPGGVPVVYVDGLDDREVKILNLTLNKVQGSWDYEKLPIVVQEILDGVDLNIADEDLEVSVAGFDFAEINDLLDLSIQPDLGEVEPFEKISSGERVLTYRLPEEAADEVEAILLRFGADEFKKRSAALLKALRVAAETVEARQAEETDDGDTDHTPA
ncbi:hypothetical protein LCGC14_0455580 [marine sediment metagenome]|uniref:ParB-like N-terminal domain-containing protein n=1 Tax=marine sediment metagenome TaxID=412755 RepID=A0A0F9SZI2_9ZZZZ